MRRLFIVRHGNTFEQGQPLRRVGARTDMPLVASGEAQAKALGGWFAAQAIHFDRALSGRLARARRTAEIILAASDPRFPLEIADFLNEIDHGPDENALEEDVIARIGRDAIDAWDRQAQAPKDWRVDRGPRLSAWSDLLRADADETLLLVTSNGAARFALLAAGIDIGRHPLKLRTGAYGEIRVRAPDRCEILCWDQRPPDQ